MTANSTELQGTPASNFTKTRKDTAMMTRYRILIRKDADSEPWLSRPFVDLDECGYVCRGLTRNREDVEARVVREDEYCGSSVLPRVMMEAQGSTVFAHL
jgi:hypothetical protein